LGAAQVPIFILTAPGLPGQTLAAMLARGGAAYDVPELNLLLAESVSGLMRDLVGIRAVQMHGILRALAQLLAGEQTLGSVEMARRWMLRRGYQTTANAFDEILEQVAPRRLVMPLTAPLFEGPTRTRLALTYPAARYVRLLAHPHFYGRHVSVDTLAQVAMQLAGAMDPDQRPAVPDPQSLWLLFDQAEDELQGLLGENQLIPVQIEQLLTDPEATLTRLAASLDLPADAQSIARMMCPETSVFAGIGPMGASVQGAITSVDEMKKILPDPASSRLDESMPWQLEGRPFSDETIARARAHGYADASDVAAAAEDAATSSAAS
jgi:hypothetical protein